MENTINPQDLSPRADEIGEERSLFYAREANVTSNHLSSSFVTNAILDAHARGMAESRLPGLVRREAFERGRAAGVQQLSADGITGFVKGRKFSTTDLEEIVSCLDPEAAKALAESALSALERPRAKVDGKSLALAIVNPLERRRNLTAKQVENLGVAIEAQITRVLKGAGIEVV